MSTSLGGMRTVVLGANSFAGAAVIKELLILGCDVVGISRSPELNKVFRQYAWQPFSGKYRFVQSDINHHFELIAATVSEFRPTIFIDLAGQGMVAESWDAPEQWYLTNIVAKVKLHDHLRQLKCLKLYLRVSTPEVYGSQNNLQRESWILNPSTPYAVSHSAIDMSLRAFNIRYNFPVIFARFANFYGPGQQLYRIIPRTIIYCLTKRKLQLHGGGAAVRAFIHGSDVASALISTITSGKIGEIYHFSPKDFLTIKEVVSKITTLMHVDYDELVEIAPDRPSKDQSYLMDTSKAREELGWAPAVDFEAGIAETGLWIKNNLDDIMNLPLHYIHKD